MYVVEKKTPMFYGDGKHMLCDTERDKNITTEHVYCASSAVYYEDIHINHFVYVYNGHEIKNYVPANHYRHF